MATEISQSTTIVIILIVVSVIFITAISAFVQTNVTAQTVKGACQLSIEKKLFLDSKVYFLNPYEIECPRRIILVNEEKSQILNAELFSKVSSASQYSYMKRSPEGVRSKQIRQETLKQDLHEAIAYEMTECWDTFGRGQQDVLDPASKILRGSSCFVCAEFHFQQLPRTQIDVYEELNNSHHLLDDLANRYISYDDFLYGMNTQANANTCIQERISNFNETTDDVNGLAVIYYREGKIPSCQAVATIPLTDLPKRCFAII